MARHAAKITAMASKAHPGKPTRRQPPRQAAMPHEAAWLSGQVLIAMPSMQDPRFAQAVIYLCAHSPDGAMGLVINKPMEKLSFDELLTQHAPAIATLREALSTELPASWDDIYLLRYVLSFAEHERAATVRKALAWRAAHAPMVAAAAGLASNLAALRALATEGIQRGHMTLHARSVAASVGAAGSEVEAVAAAIVKARTITAEAAKAALESLRASGARA